MDYRYKYNKYKQKYINLKKTFGGKIVSEQYEITTMNENNINIKKKENIKPYRKYQLFLNNSKSINLVYENKFIKISLFLKHVVIKNDNIINFDNVNEIDKIIIQYNDNEIEEYNNIELSDKLKKVMLDLNDKSKIYKNVYNECIEHIHKINDKVQKLFSIYACNKIHSKIKNPKYHNLIYFLHDVTYLGTYKNVNKKEINKYADSLFKTSLPITLSSDFIEIQKDKEFVKLKDVLLNALIDTGNSGYTIINENFRKKIKDGYDYDEIDYCNKVKGVGGSEITCSKLVKFKIKIYEKIYDIIAQVNDDIKETNEVNELYLLFGSKCGIDLLFGRDMIIDKCEDDELRKELSNAYMVYIKKFDSYLDYEFKRNIKINDEFIDDFIISYLEILIDYSYNLTKSNKLKEIIIKKDYLNLLNNNKQDTVETTKSFIKKHNIINPNKTYGRYCLNIDDKFINRHFETIKNVYSKIKNIDFDGNVKINSFINLLREIIV